MPSETGTVRAVARTDGEEGARHVLRTAGEPHAIELDPDRSEIRANGEDISSARVRVTDAKGIRAPYADAEVHFDVEEPGKNIGVGNSNYESVAPYKAEHRSGDRGGLASS